MQQRLRDAIAVGHHFYDVKDIAARVKSGEWQWFQNRDGVCITMVAENKLGERYLQGKFIFGDLDAVMEMSDRIDQFGRDEGCVRFTMDGRTGWTKVLKKYGWQVAGVIMSKDL